MVKKRFTLVIQIHPDTQERNVSFMPSDNPLYSIEDCLVKAGGWVHAKVVAGYVDVEGDDELLEALGEREFRADGFVDPGQPELFP